MVTEATAYEYRVIPAPRKARRIRGLKRGEDRFAASVAEILNELGAEGWEYQRSDTLPLEARSGLTGHTTTFRTMLVFRRVVRVLGDDIEATAGPESAPAPAPDLAPDPDPAPELPPEPPLAAAAPADTQADTQAGIQADTLAGAAAEETGRSA